MDAFNPLSILPYDIPQVGSTVSLTVDEISLGAGSTQPIIALSVATSRLNFDRVRVRRCWTTDMHCMPDTLWAS